VQIVAKLRQVEVQMVQGMRIALAIFEMLDPAEGISGIPGRATEMDTS